MARRRRERKNKLLTNLNVTQGRKLIENNHHPPKSNQGDYIKVSIESQPLQQNANTKTKHKSKSPKYTKKSLVFQKVIYVICGI